MRCLHVLDADLLVDFRVLEPACVELDKELSLLDTSPLGNQVEDGRGAFDLALDDDLLPGIDGSHFNNIDFERSTFYDKGWGIGYSCPGTCEFDTKNNQDKT